MEIIVTNFGLAILTSVVGIYAIHMLYRRHGILLLDLIYMVLVYVLVAIILTNLEVPLGVGMLKVIYELTSIEINIRL